MKEKLATLIIMVLFLVGAVIIAQGLYSLAGIGNYQVTIPVTGGGEYQLVMESEEVGR